MGDSRYDIASCPFCKTDYVGIVRSSDYTLYKIWCKSCNATGPVVDKFPGKGGEIKDIKLATIKEWNSTRRPGHRSLKRARMVTDNSW